jgi:LemA protein
VGKLIGIIVVIALLFVIVTGVSGYNGLVKKNEAVNQAWGQVENQYQRRSDLIGNLVETVKGAAKFEQETLTKVTEARASASQVKLTPEMLNDPQALQKFQAAQDQLSGALSRLLVTVEQYPELKATANFMELQNQLEGTENRIAVERRRFNEVAQDYNVAVKRFPMSMLAGMFGFHPKAYFQSQPGSEQAPKVQF